MTAGLGNSNALPPWFSFKIKGFVLKSAIMFLATAIAIGAASSRAAAPSARSGQYNALTLAVVDGAVTGTFFDARGSVGPGGAAQLSCVFLLRGRLEGDRAKIDTWAPGGKERIAGELVFKGNDVMIKLVKDQPGCGMTGDDMVSEFYKASGTMKGIGWIGVATVSVERAAFRPAPNAPAPRRPYIVENDPVVILARKGEWVRVTYIGGRKPVTGWLRRDELVSGRPPARLVRAQDDGAASSTAANWIGLWTSGDQEEIDIKRAAGGDISLEGYASWGAEDPKRAASGAVNVGEFEAVITPHDNEVAFVIDDAGEARPYDALPDDVSLCRMRLRRRGAELAVLDNGKCGGFNVTFSGKYRRKKSSPP